MNEQEKKAWDAALKVARIHLAAKDVSIWDHAILAADAELTRLREENEGLRKEMATARKFGVLRENMNLKRERTRLRTALEIIRDSLAPGENAAGLYFLTPSSKTVVDNALLPVTDEAGSPPLTRDYKETVIARIKDDPAFAQALLDEVAALTKERNDAVVDAAAWKSCALQTQWRTSGDNMPELLVGGGRRWIKYI